LTPVLGSVRMISSVIDSESTLAGCCLIIQRARPISVRRKRVTDELPSTSLCVVCWTGCRNTHPETTPHKADRRKSPLRRADERLPVLRGGRKTARSMPKADHRRDTPEVPAYLGLRDHDLPEMAAALEMPVCLFRLRERKCPVDCGAQAM